MTLKNLKSYCLLLQTIFLSNTSTLMQLGVKLGVRIKIRYIYILLFQ